MPSKSPAQKRMMAAAAHDPAFAKKVGVPTSVAKEFNSADMHQGMGGGKPRDAMGGGSKAPGKGPMGGKSGKGMVPPPKGRK